MSIPLIIIGNISFLLQSLSYMSTSIKNLRIFSVISFTLADIFNLFLAFESPELFVAVFWLTTFLIINLVQLIRGK